nr:ribonuclease H-like domain-containing protein [Tanacetum cinerariifolium]
MILSGTGNRAPILDKDLYDSWKSRMELYMQNKEHGRMIVESVEHGPLIWPTIEEKDSSFVVPVFSPGDDPIDCLNKAMVFLTAVAFSRGDKGKIILVLRIKEMLLVQGEVLQVDRQELLNATTAKTKDLDTYYSDYDDLLTAQAVLMANIYNYGSDVISEETVQDTNLQAQQDSMILSVIEQMSEQMINHVNNWEKSNKEQNNKSITAELERYKERVKTFEQRLNIDLVEHDFWLHISNPTIKSSSPPIRVEVSSELPKVSLVNESLKKLKFQLTQFDCMVKKRTTHNALTEDFGYSKHMTEKCSQLMNFVSKFLGTVRFGNDQIVRIIGYVDYQLGNIIISRVYYVEGLRHNLFFVGQICDADLEVAFRKNTCFIRNLKGVDLLFESRDTNLYTISLDEMLKSSLICLLFKASKTKSWLWHHQLSHLNFGTLNKLAKDGLARGIPRLKFQKGHLCLACALRKCKKSSHQPKAIDTNQEKLYLLHMNLCSPMHVASINRKRYILVIVDDYSRFTWVRFLQTKDEAPTAIIKCIKDIQVHLNATVRNVIEAVQLKVGASIILLRNLNIASGLCNGTRLIVTQLLDKVIEARIITGMRMSKKVFLSRITLINRDLQLPFIFKRKQFLIKLCYAMTINKSQGQSLERIGIFLPEPVFTYGQFLMTEMSTPRTNPIDKGKLPLVEANIGNAIQANMDLKDTDYFNQLLQLNNAYRISRFMCTQTKIWDRTLPNQTTLLFGRYTSIIPISNVDFPEHYFNLIAYNEVDARADVNGAPLAGKLQADCDLKATNIVLQGLPLDVYALVNHHKVSKYIWDRVKLLMQGTSLSKQECDCKLHDKFDKFSYMKGLVVPTFLPGDDPIACINKEMEFLLAVSTPRYPSTNNQLRSSSNLRNQGTVHDGRVTVQQVQRRQAKVVLMASFSSCDSDVISE